MVACGRLAPGPARRPRVSPRAPPSPLPAGGVAVRAEGSLMPLPTAPIPPPGPPPMLECPDLGLPRLHRGKVREMFAIDAERLLLVATDRLSAFDVVFPQGIPGKGEVLTRISALWFQATGRVVPGHLLTLELDGLGLPPDTARRLHGRSMVVRRARRIDVECVVRGYLSGSGWREYQQSGTVCGIALPPGLRLNDRLPEPVFTPALKNDAGHDENVSFGVLCERAGHARAEELREVSLRLYRFGAERLAAAGLILADTKFEFGLVGPPPVDGRPDPGTLTLIDEVFTPDSSRIWPVEQYRPGEPVDSLDKQPVRDFVQSIGWNLEPPAPALPPAIVAETAHRYQEALRRVRAALA